MKEEVFEEILRCIKLPLGKLLKDGSTYLITSKEFIKIGTKQIEELGNFDKFLVITNGQQIVVGGILFYGSVDIQAITFPEFRGKHFMSAIHKNGILKSECYPNKKVTISKHTIKSFDDFCMKHYMLSCAGLKVSNLIELHKYFNIFKECERFKGFQQDRLEQFVERFS